MPKVKVAPAQQHENLTIFPLVHTAPEELPYQLLTDALEAGTLEVTELGTGSVPDLVAHNGGDADVLIIDGEQLIGAKQDRMVSRTIVIPAQSEVTIPVSCMEQGRWRFTSRRFKAGRRHSPGKVRRHARAVEAKMAAAQQPAAAAVLAGAQGEVWDTISQYYHKMDAHSPSDALDELYEQKSFDLEEWAKSFPRVEGQTGMLAFLGNEPLGLDIFVSPEVYARMHERLLYGYLMDGLAAFGDQVKWHATPAAAQAFLDSVDAAPRVKAPTVGRGTYRVLADAVLGGELEDRSRLVHLSAFPGEEAASGEDLDSVRPIE